MPSKLDVDRLEFFVLGSAAGLTSVPEVLTFSHYGTGLHDIPTQFEAAEQRCRERGLLNRAGKVNDAVWDALSPFQTRSLEFDLRFSVRKGTELRAAVAQSGQTASRVVMNGDRFILDRVRPAEMIPALVAVLPEHQPMKMQPVNVNLTELRATMQEAERQGITDQRAIEQRLRSRGVDLTGYRKATKLLDGHKLGQGEVGVTAWDSNRKSQRGDSTVRVFDLEGGRVAIYNSGNERMLAGCDAGTCKRVLGGLASKTQRAMAW